MRETSADLDRLQQLLDTSYERAGVHLRRVITPERRLTAVEVVERLPGMCLLSLATVTADCRPVVGPVDGFFYRGEFWFGSATDSLRVRHIEQRPQVSATHLPGESLSVTVHGRAFLVERGDSAYAGFWDVCREVYGPEWDDWATDAMYARIRADWMFTFSLEG